jgi:hypothetical protein
VLLLTAAGVLYSGGGRDRPEPADPPLAHPEPSQAHPEPSQAHADPSQATVPAFAPPPTPLPAGVRLPIPEGMVGVPVALGTPTAVAMVRPGDRIDLLLVPGDGEPVAVARDVPVLAVVPSEAALFLALSPAQAQEVVATTGRFAVLVRP